MEIQETTVPAPEIKKRSRASTPSADLKLKDLSQTISANWLLNSQITLVWIEPKAFNNSAMLFGTSLEQRLTTRGGRAVLTNNLKTLDKTIDQHTDYLKDYLKEKFGKENYFAYFPQFGIVKQGNIYSFPFDHTNRNEALKFTVQAIQTLELQDRTYGMAFWQDISRKYDMALKDTIITDSSVSGLVKTKNEHRQIITKTLNALIHIIKGNYPDTYASVLREWGFQKEKY